MSTDPNNRISENRSMLWRLSAVALLMFGFGFALVPFYDQICSALGINNLAAAEAGAPRNTQVDMSRTITIEFDANAHNLPWRFRALERHITVHPGELSHVEFEVENDLGRPVTAQAIPSYGPQTAGQFFRKVECFCFAQQTFAAGETRKMPVVFVVDPAVPKDMNTITLSYTFFEVPGKGNGA